ncbi:unnamed protein product [Dibothriocephalus latus]|uniref:Uncharacterized protein n=1 Tax=Dibothriocephalus latus TaxID=60516 RepID=A0A3P6SXX6_DIBLA|nr:unnamed protein product [Dibothriocephalus latus]
MSGVKNAMNELKAKQEALQTQLDERDDEIKKAQSENYEVLEQNKLSLERQVLLLQQKIKSTQKLLEQKEGKIKELQALNTSESSESLSLKSQDVDARRDELLNQLKDARDEANRMDMQYEEDSNLSDEVSELQRQLQEATRKAEISEMEIVGVEQLIKTADAALTKQKEENAKIKKELDDMHIELGA